MPGLWMHMLDFARAMPCFQTDTALMREPDRVIESVRWVLCPAGRLLEGNVATAKAARNINRDSNTPGSSLIRLSSFSIRLRPASPAGWTSLARQFLRPSAGCTQ